MALLAEAQKESITGIQEAGYGHGRWDKPSVINMPALPRAIGNLTWKFSHHRLSKIARDPATIKKMQPEMNRGTKRPQAIYRKTAARSHGKAVKLIVDVVEVQAPAMHIASAIAIA